MNIAVRHSSETHRRRELELGELARERLQDDKARFKHFGEFLETANHDYDSLALFSDEALIDLLSRYPRRRLQCFTMGTDPTKPEQWQAVCIRGVSGADLFHAIKNGRIWVNVTNIDQHDSRYRELIVDMYKQVEAMCPTVENPGLYYNTLVLASPKTQFYYHVNPENNMLWNMRGTFKLSALPAMDFRFVSQEMLEEIFACEASGSIAYRHEYEQFAKSIDITDAQCAWWPQTAPIRMQYETFSVSLVTSYFCPMRHRREWVQLANRFLLRGLGIRNRRVDEQGVRSELKQLAFRTMRKCFPTRKAYDFTDSYVTNLRVNLNSPKCIEKIDQIIIPEFSKFSEVFPR